MTQQTDTAVLLMTCRDRPGIIAAVSGLIAEHGGNILDLEEHVERDHNVFAMRLHWTLSHADRLPRFETAYAERIGKPFSATWKIRHCGERPRMAIFVSKLSHCLYDLLARVEAKEWDVDVPVVVGNHDDLRPIAQRFGIPFEYVPVDPAAKAAAEDRQRDILATHNIDFIVLARYMQVLSADFVDGYRHRILNIHHSFLPAFPGANPYRAAFERGVKMIGATSHYVTQELDAGPIVAQDAVQVSHIDTVDDMVRKGRDLEKIVLARAVWNHLQHKVLVCGNRTIVFQ